jgi:serine/threonine-protein kinase HipA
MPRARYETLSVFLNSRLVGRLSRDIPGAISFQYDRSWLEWEFVMPVSLSLPLREQAYAGAPVVAVFDNLLPDNDHLRRQIAARIRAALTRKNSGWYKDERLIAKVGMPADSMTRK